jgi:eukaryotic-like serine/threonine-protein kinase
MNNPQPLHWNDPRFHLSRLLGAGGMGVVYEAFDARRGFPVALKTVEQLSPEGLLQLKREFRVASQLRHPNLVRFYDLVVKPERCFFTLELLEGQNLISYVRARSTNSSGVISADSSQRQEGVVSSAWVSDTAGGFDVARLLSTFSQICAALDFLHQAKTVHRDLKPSNIFVSSAGKVKILDFGISRSTSQLEVGDAAITGTPQYMSPEQVRGGRASPASDLYSLGVILYLLLTGQPPFQGKTTRELMEKHLTAVPVLPSTLVAEVPQQLENLCLRLLDKAPEMRSTARDILHYLVLCGAPPVSLSRQAGRFIGRASELAALQQSAVQVLHGEQRAVLLSGESGLGKSALAREFLRTLSVKAWRVLSGRCYEREQLSYNAIDPLVDAMTLSLSSRYNKVLVLPEGFEHAAAMFPVLKSLSPQLDELPASLVLKPQAIRAICALFEILREGRGLVIYLDDLQWADEDSISLLAGLLEAGHFLLLGTFRAQEITGAHHLQTIIRHARTTSISLPRFGQEEVRALLGEQATESLIEWVVQETSGNALFASELSFSLSSQQSHIIDLNQLFLVRLSSLPTLAKQVLEVVVLAGSALDFETLLETTEATAAALTESIDQLLGDRWLQELEGQARGEFYDVYHARIREVLYPGSTSVDRVEIHSRLGRSFFAQNNIERAASHLLQAGRQTEAAPLLLQAARQAVRLFALLNGVRLYQQALQAGGDAWGFAQETRVAIADTLERIGSRNQEAAAAFREAASYASGAEAVRLLLRAARADLRRGDVDAALESAKQAIAPYERLEVPAGAVAALAEAGLRTLQVEWRLRSLRRLPGRAPSESNLLRHLLYHQMSMSLAYFDLYRSAVFSARALTLALEAGTNEQLVDTLFFYSLLVSFRRSRKSLAQAQALHAKSQQWRSPDHDPEMVLVSDLIGGMIAQAAGDFEGSVQSLRQVLEAYRLQGFLNTPEVLLANAFLLGSSTYGGSPHLHTTQTKLLHERAVAEKDQPTLLNLTPIYSLNMIWLGQYDEARRLLLTMPKNLGETSIFVSAAEISRALLLLHDGSPLSAAMILERLLSNPLQSGLLVNAEQKLRAQLALSLSYLAIARCAPTRGTRLEALSSSWRYADRLTRSNDPVFEGAGLRVQGLIAQARSNSVEAKHLLDRAVASLSLRGEITELSAALLARGALYGCSSDLARGQQLFSQAGYADPRNREGNSWGFTA